MPKRGAAVHVATTTREYKGRVYKSYLLRRTFREDGKVKHETLGNLSHLPETIIEIVRRALKGQKIAPVDETFKILRSLPHGHVAATLGTLRKIGLEKVIASKPSRERELVLALIVARLIEPRSKLATSRGLDEKTSSLVDVLGLENVDEDDLYDAMDWLIKRKPGIEKKLAKQRLENGALVLYDVSSTYFEGSKCPLAHLGYSRDERKQNPQIVFGLLTDSKGCPVAVEIFDGNTGDPSTLGEQVKKIQQRFGLERVVLVADRGMLTEARIDKDLRPNKLDWITSLRAPAIQKLAESEALQLSLFDEKDLVEIRHESFPDERLIVCRNPILAERRATKREELLKATERELDKIVKATQRKTRPLRGKDQIALRVGKIWGRFRMAKHFNLKIEDDSFSYERKLSAIEKEAALDGIYVIRTNLTKSKISPQKAVEAYKNLSVVERAFRSFKTVDLKVRPIYHRRPNRVRAHIFVCMLAYYVEWHMKQNLAPLLFDDEDKAGARAKRTSPVAPAQRSESALRKAKRRRTPEGLPVHDFQGLLKALATLCKNQVQASYHENAVFDQFTQPTPLQKRAFELLGMSYRM